MDQLSAERPRRTVERYVMLSTARSECTMQAHDVKLGRAAAACQKYSEMCWHSKRQQQHSMFTALCVMHGEKSLMAGNNIDGYEKIRSPNTVWLECDAASGDKCSGQLI